MASLKRQGYIYIRSMFSSSQIEELIREFEALKNDKLESKNISQSSSYDADQKRFEIMNPTLLTHLYKNNGVGDLMGRDIEESLKVNNRCGYYFYLEGSYIKPHFDHLLSDCMLLISLRREYGKNQPVGGLLRMYIPKTISFDRSQQKAGFSGDGQVVEIDLKPGDGILVAGGHIYHECTALEKGGVRLVCGLGYAFQRARPSKPTPLEVEVFSNEN